MVAYDEAGTETIAEFEMVATADDGTLDGTFEYSTTANPTVVKAKTWVDGNDETIDKATTTGDEKVDGKVTWVGAEI
jgi:hypothetical protein